MGRSNQVAGINIAGGPVDLIEPFVAMFAEFGFQTDFFPAINTAFFIYAGIIQIKDGVQQELLAMRAFNDFVRQAFVTVRAFEGHENSLKFKLKSVKS